MSIYRKTQILAKIFLFSFVLLLPIDSKAEDEVKDYVENVAVVGQAKFSYLFLDIYNATLYAENGIFEEGKPFALKLEYLRDFSGKDIAKRTTKEIRKQGFNQKDLLNIWQKKLENIFPDVRESDYLIGVRDEVENTIFYFNGKRIGQIDDKLFSKKFFDIWLGEKTPKPKLRNKLLGLY